MLTKTESKSTAVLTAVITRADGTVEDLGVIAAGYRNPVKQLWWDLVGQRLAERRIKRANSRAQRSK